MKNISCAFSISHPFSLDRFYLCNQTRNFVIRMFFLYMYTYRIYKYDLKKLIECRCTRCVCIFYCAMMIRS